GGDPIYSIEDQVQGLLLFFVVNMKTKDALTVKDFFIQYPELEDIDFEALFKMGLFQMASTLIALDVQEDIEYTILDIETSDILYEGIVEAREKTIELENAIRKIKVERDESAKDYLKNKLMAGYNVEEDVVEDLLQSVSPLQAVQ
ncbi:MAG TPA: hypothetical protein DCL21_01660, partial [Alphaproteobacteria bacterium]|nr:hypothetical protein [Alphaproteobacteria bacterium]